MAVPTEQAAQLPHFFWCGAPLSSPSMSTCAAICAASPWQGALATCLAGIKPIPCAQVMAAAANPWKGTATSTSQTSRVRTSVFTRGF